MEDDEYEIPLRDQRYFGAGVKRKRIQFVTSTGLAQSTSLPSTPSTSAADRYLSIVLKKPESEIVRRSSPPSEEWKHSPGAQLDDASGDQDAVHQESGKRATCSICKRPLSVSNATQHESSITHQICLQHSHPPSHIDRTRKGLNVLESQGWDPDSRLGLGAEGSEGRLYPVRATENPQRAGLGARFDKAKVMEKTVRLDAGKVRLVEQKGKGKAEALRNAFYRSEEVEKYLGQEQADTALDLEAFKRSKRGT
ncbi:hypothetical protein LTR36_005465 [Oleoguttula mirabilis]|uniref:G-patch domain-containing protein n=1 Tax=Oleoguttula mirabilis TaxID=1507867 RepID=A0AAV9JEC0_9PEZI|nr:hypothetical protein LTR36_005465 [Oleoguttula mirabilis]